MTNDFVTKQIRAEFEALEALDYLTADQKWQRKQALRLLTIRLSFAYSDRKEFLIETLGEAEFKRVYEAESSTGFPW